MLNIYIICIDSSVLSKGTVKEDLESVVEFISLLFAGKFNDNRLRKYDVEFEYVVKKHEKELTDMAKYYSDVEKIVAESETKGRVEGRVYGIIDMCLEDGYNDEMIISKLQKKLGIDLTKAKEYLLMYRSGELC